MKKVLFSVLTIALMALVSCTKEETVVTKAVVDCTIDGKSYVNGTINFWKNTDGAYSFLGYTISGTDTAIVSMSLKSIAKGTYNTTEAGGISLIVGDNMTTSTTGSNYSITITETSESIVKGTFEGKLGIYGLTTTYITVTKGTFVGVYNKLL